MIGSRLKDAPTDIDDLARILGIGFKQLRGLREKHGDGLLLHMQRTWRDRQDRPHLLASRSERGYTDQPELAMAHEPEAVSPSYQTKISGESHVDFAELRRGKQKELDERAFAARARQLNSVAKKKGIDPSPFFVRVEAEFRALESELEAA